MPRFPAARVAAIGFLDSSWVAMMVTPLLICEYSHHFTRNAPPYGYLRLK
ncbi:MAG: hypothetical protein H6672_04135 [Anaerolineaceae bacterium]|nr:hypothetical protein [Anaerolineaceae bacterium]